MDYTNWTNDDLARLRGLQRDEGADGDEVEAVEQELRRRNPAPPAIQARLRAGTPPTTATAATRAQDGHTPQSGPPQNGSSAEPQVSEPPPFALHNGRRSFVSVLTIWLVLVALAVGAGGGMVTYSVSEGLGGGRLLVTLIGAVAAATPYLAVVAFMDLASEGAQGVTWIANYLNEQVRR